MNPRAGLALLLLGSCPQSPEATSAGSSSTSSSSSAASSTSAPTSAPADAPPKAVIALDPKAGPAPLLVKLLGGASSDPEGPLVAYEWTFGDGAAGVGPALEHLYQEPGTYEVSLTVTDGAGQSSAAATTLSVGAECPPFVASGSPGKLDLPALNEASGLAASRRGPVLWTHNDSDPDGPYLYAFAAADGRYLGRYALTGATVVDWEDLALGPGVGPEQDDLYLADIGDNPKVRGKITVYRAPEPAVDPAQEPVSAALTPTALDFTYPGGQAHDAETLLVDPVRGDLCVVTKRMDGLSEAYCRAAPLSSGTLALAATLDLGMAALATGGSVSPDGRLVAVRTYLDARVWRRKLDAPLSDAFLSPSCPLALTLEIQGESIGFAADGLGYYTVSEGEAPSLHAYRRQ